LVIDDPPHFKYAATLPCYLSLIACFADVNVSQGSVETYARSGGTTYNQITANLLVKKIVNRLRIMVVGLCPHFFAPPCIASEMQQPRSAIASIAAIRRNDVAWLSQLANGLSQLSVVAHWNFRSKYCYVPHSQLAPPTPPALPALRFTTPPT